MTIEFSTKVKDAARQSAAALAMATLVACGGGGSSGGTPSSQPPPAAEKTGTVGLLLRDGPTDEFCQVLAEIERVDLLGANGPTNIFMGPETIDLLALKNFTDVVTVATEVPIGTYEKVRLTLADLSLVECDDQGNPEPESQWYHPNLPGNGKLDLNPRGSFQVVGGETVLIQLDVDMDKSLHVVQAGNSGRWQFRPVVFVDIMPDSERLVRVYGQARDATNGSFEICSVEAPSSTDDDNGGGGGGGMNGDDDSGRCLDVFVDGDAGVFGPSGSPGGPVANGDLLTAIGFLSLHDDDDDGDSKADDLKLDAVVIEIGEQGTFQRIRGAAATAPGTNSIFEFDPAAVADATDIIDVLLQSGTRIFEIDSTNELTAAAIQPGTTAEVDGVFTIPASSGQPLKAALVVLDQDTTPERSIINATIAAIPADNDAVPETRRIDVNYGILTNQCVTMDASTRYLKITEAAGSSTTQEVTFADLLVSDKIDVHGTDDTVNSGCVLADVIQKYVPAP
jgi:hypothetical protein